MLEQVVKTLTRYSMIAPGARLGIAVSGGCDSVALLHILRELARGWGWTLTVLHLDHCLRGAESEQDARFVAETAASLDLPAVIERCDVSQARSNIEEAARAARYAFFRDAMRRERLDRVAVGHTRSDQAETVLFRLLRGSGTTGLAGIWPVTEDGIVRPLIEVDREDVLAYLRDRGLRWREDSSNCDRRFSRNRVRQELLPQLRRDWNPEIDAALGRLAAICQEEERYWRAESAKVLETAGGGPSEAPPPEVVPEVILDVRKLREVPVAMLRRMLRAAVARLPGEGRGLGFDHFEELLELTTRSGGAGRATLPGIDACRSFGWLRIAAAGERKLEYRVRLPVPGEVELPWGGKVLAELERQGKQSRYNTSAEALDWDRVSDTLELRNWSPGARFRPSGEAHEYKIRDLFQQARVPLWERCRWPLIRTGSSVIWVRGFGVAEGFAASESTRNVLRVRAVNMSWEQGSLREPR